MVVLGRCAVSDEGVTSVHPQPLAYVSVGDKLIRVRLLRKAGLVNSRVSQLAAISQPVSRSQELSELHEAYAAAADLPGALWWS